MSERATQPIEGVADGRLAGFVAEKTGQNAILHDARHTGNITIFVRVEHVATAGAHHHDERSRLGSSRPWYAGMGIDDRRR